MNKGPQVLNNIYRFVRYHKIISERHLKSINMTYREHLKHSMNFSYMFSKSSFKAFTHAIIPSMYKTSTTDTIQIVFKELEGSLKNNNRIKK